MELEIQQIVHGDIKTNNCLFKRKSDSSIECVIADFGGSFDLSKNLKWSYGTPGYLLEEDRKAYFSLTKQWKSKTIKSEKDKLYIDLKNILLRRDVYAMGITLANLLKGSYNKKGDRKNKELHSLIRQMQEKSWEKRISASEVLAEFERIFSLPDLNEAI